jgi:acetyl esterase/lipase
MALSADTLASMRDLVRTLGVDGGNLDRPVDRIELDIPSLFGTHAIKAYLYRPQAPHGRRPALLHLHGGGFVAGHPLMSDSTNREIAHEIDCCVLSVDYRLAPETPHPGPIEDCYSVLDWLFQNAVPLGIDPWRLALKGDSAGGGLAASLALLNRDCGTVPLIFQLLMYPMLDDRTGTARAATSTPANSSGRKSQIASPGPACSAVRRAVTTRPIRPRRPALRT